MIEKLKQEIIKANKAYRLGNSIISDKDYDRLVDELKLMSPKDELLKKIGHEINDISRKSKLPIQMASMNKTKTIEDLQDWIRLKSIKNSESVVITPKYDGLSLCVNEESDEAWTRGDGEYGQKSDKHYEKISNKLSPACYSFKYTYGEIIMKKNKFLNKYSNDFANPRNLVAGLLNSKKTSDYLFDCDYVKYGAITKNNFKTKKEILDELNINQEVKVPYHTCSISDLNEDLLINLFKDYSTDFEIDGLIIEINNLEYQSKLGRETSSNNPVWARAFKHSSFEQSATTEVIGLNWNISKQGYLKPVLHIDPVRLDGVTVSNVTGNNARFVKDMGLGIGAKVVVKRSGMVIPIISDVIETVDFVIPNTKDIEWNENGVELITLNETDDQKLKKNIAFFSILGADNVSEGIIKQLWDSGHKTIKDILSLTKEDLMKIDRFGKRKSEIVFNSIQNSVKDVELSKLQHATGIFKGLGSKKLVLLEKFQTKPTIEEVTSIEGFAEKSAKTYIDSYDRFFDFIKDLPITIKETKEVEVESNDLKGNSYVFSGVRRKDLNEIIESRGGSVASGVSGKTTHLIMKATGTGSSKERKAEKLDVKIMTVEQLEKELNV